MPKLRVNSFSMSLDGYSAGPNQSLENPLGEGGPAVFQWFFATEVFQKMHGGEGGSAGIDNDFALRGFENVGAWILGRNMFGPIRGPWVKEGQPNDEWKGWWGDEPPYHVQTFVLTNHPRPSIEMRGGTTFHFVTGGIREALERATDAANGKDVRVGGGVSTIRQYIQADLIDELHLAVSPVLLGSGENLLAGINLPQHGFKVVEHIPTAAATHIVLAR
jgi:dihydrofolate reductase